MVQHAISRTPLRISFCGGGTDYPEFYEHHGGGEVIGATIDKYITVIASHDPGFMFTEVNGKVYQLVSEIENPIVRGCFEQHGDGSGISLRILSDVSDRGCGLGSSSALAVGVLKALRHLRGDKTSMRFGDAFCVERNRAGFACGKQDHFLCGYGGVAHIYFGKDYNDNPLDVLYQPFPCDIELLRPHLMLVKVVNRDHKPKMDMKIDAVYLKAIRALVSDFAVALDKKDYREFGELLDTSWTLKRSLSDSVSTPEINRLYDRALSAGAYGGKLLGAGGGGYFLLCFPLEKIREIWQAVVIEKGATPLPFSFTERGSVIL